MNINKSFKVDSLSKDDLILWFRKNVSNKLHSIEELGTGGDFLIAVEMLIPGTVSLQKLKVRNTTESERLRNFKTLRKIFHKFGIDKDIEAEKMVRGLFKENYHFALWFRSFFKANYVDTRKSPLDPLHPLRHLKRAKAGLVSEYPEESETIRHKEDLPDINQNAKNNNSVPVLQNLNESEEECAPLGTTRILKKDSHLENNKFKADVTKYCTIKNTSKQDLIRWFRSTLSPNLHSIEELGTGADYCLGLEVLFAGSIPIHQVRFSKTTESERIANFRIFGRALDELGVEKEIVAERLAKGIFKDNFQFAQWYRCFFMSNYRGQTYNIAEIRAAKRKKLKSRIDFPNDQTTRISTKGYTHGNLEQGDTFCKNGKFGLPGVGNKTVKVDASSQTNQPLPNMNCVAESSVQHLDKQDKLWRIRVACEDHLDNDLSKTIIRLLDGGDANDDTGDEYDDEDIEDEEEEDEEGDEGVYGVSERSQEIRHHSGPLLPAL